MTKNEYLASLSGKNIDHERVKRLKTVYHATFPELICKIISDNNTSVFLGNGVRILSYSEMLDAERDLHIEFDKNGIIPIVDCGENDFIVYHFRTGKWSKYNIIDEIPFSMANSLAEIL